MIELPDFQQTKFVLRKKKKYFAPFHLILSASRGKRQKQYLQRFVINQYILIQKITLEKLNFYLWETLSVFN